MRPHVGRREDVLLVDAVEVGEEGLDVADPDRPGPSNGDRLDVLGAHEGAGPAPSGLVCLVRRETRPGQQVLSRGAVGHGLHVRVEIATQGVLELADLHAHVGRGRAQLDDVVLDPDQCRLGGAAGHDDGVVACELELGAERSPDVRVEDRACLGALAADHEA